jgi:hypothetical protein
MKIDVDNAPSRAGSRYPKPYDEPCGKSAGAVSASPPA